MFQKDDDEVSPQEFQNDDDVFSPAVTPENYPLMFNLLKTPAIQTVPHADTADKIIEQVEPVPIPPHPPDDQQGQPLHPDNQQDRPLHPDDQHGRPQRHPRVDYQSLHEYGRSGADAWSSEKKTDHQEDE